LIAVIVPQNPPPMIATPVRWLLDGDMMIRGHVRMKTGRC
jgi:hypothetical protein